MEVELVDHHCHGLVTRDLDRAEVEAMLTEADGPGLAGTLFDSQIGFALRRWCSPLLDLEPHAPTEDYLARRAELGAAEVNRRMLAPTGIGTFLVDTGYLPEPITSPDELAALAGGTAREVVRLEAVAEEVLAGGCPAGGFPGAFRERLAERCADAVGVKSIAAYRAGLALDGARPADGEVAGAAGALLSAVDGGARPRVADPVLHRFLVWCGIDLGLPVQFHVGYGEVAGAAGALLSAADGGARLRVADPVLHRFLVWCGIDLGLPVQFHVGYGDADVDLHRGDPLLLSDLLRATEPAGVPVMLLHNYPFHRNAGYLAQVFGHVFVDVGLAVHNVGRRADAVVAELLELAPFGKVLFSTDAFGLAELYLIAASLFRRALGRFLDAGIADDDWTPDDAARTAAAIGAGNARRAYRLA